MGNKFEGYQTVWEWLIAPIYGSRKWLVYNRNSSSSMDEYSHPDTFHLISAWDEQVAQVAVAQIQTPINNCDCSNQNDLIIPFAII